MVKLVSIDPGKNKCGLVLAEISEKKVYLAIILKSELLENYLRNLITTEDISQVTEIKTNGNFIKKIRDFLQENRDIKFKLEIVSLRDSKTIEPIVVEINILKIAS